MRILHTSDWHAGKTLYKRDRMPDLEHALQQMLALVDSEAIDVVLVAGDLYDTFHPPARAIQGLNHFFLELHRRQIPALVIAGNHDSSHLWHSMRDILSLASIQVFDKIQAGAYWTYQTKGERLCLTALPYPSERQLVRLAEHQETVSEQRQRYADKVAGLLKLLVRDLPAADHQVLCAHLMLSGAEPTQSERALSLADTFAVQPQHLPEVFDYVALGHIHKRQAIKGSPVPAWYCGTPYQIDFGEQGMAKGVQVVDLVSGQPPQIRFMPLALLHPLQLLSCHEDQLPEIYTSWQDSTDYLKLRVSLDAPRKGLADEIRERLGPQLLQVELQTPTKSEQSVRYQHLQLEDPLAVYRTYCEAQNLPVSAELAAVFSELWESTLAAQAPV